MDEESFPARDVRRTTYRSVPCYSRGWKYGMAVLTRCDLPAPDIMQRGLPGMEGPGAGPLTARGGELGVSSAYAPCGNPSKRGKEAVSNRKLS